MPYKNIMLVMEGLAEEVALIHQAVRLGEALGATLTVIHVNDPTAGHPQMLMDSLPIVQEQDLREMFESAGYPELSAKIRIELLEDDSYVTAIEEATGEADLLVLGHHHKSAFKAAFFDSTDERLADIVDCPILLIPLDL